MDFELRGKVALVTGGTSGIGLAIARRLGEEGCIAAICGRDPDRLERACAELRLRSIAVHGFVADIAQPADVQRLVRDAIAVAGGIDIVVSNAGTHVKGMIEQIPTERLEQQLRTKVLGPWELARQVAPTMRERGGGRFIVIIGQAGKVPGADVIASAVSNAAQHALVKSLSDDLGRSNILVNAVCPSRISSPLADRLDLTGEIYLGRSLEQQESRWGADVPMGRFGTPDDIANAVVFVASARASFMCGANIDVDGGYQRSIA
jgi:NAD(P)-dependent dehydrogenase (short-subunit alcohol dehydrogenase family)